ncbi:HAMP domain-containing protein [Actinoplanes sp. TBRC 11911]|uniref:sensor histidine kinase n=1 Tax=Actinoplanes sp. TBRC 11911 TaxID=2729386 RepID=UPI00145CA6A9|nr:ATP-binding protein [Actinoplanes sp. TBRC 11911]NMO50738.1 HAMP domain-containing protein [Actinoplanes sp. TBRC 11911]
MSFRLRIFVLAMAVAVTAIGATAWLMLSLSQSQATRSRQAQVRHQAEIVDTVQRYGLRHGHWPGVDVVVAGLAQRTGLHIQLRTSDGQVLVDSDTMANRPSGLVRASAITIDPQPQLDPQIAWLASGPGTGRPPKQAIARNLFGPAPTDHVLGSPSALAVRQIAQYRAALGTVRCIGGRTKSDPVLQADTAPYLTQAQIQKYPDCVHAAVRSVLADQNWFNDLWGGYLSCLKAGGEPTQDCLIRAYTTGVTTTSAAPLQLYLGGGTVEADIGDLSRPAVLGIAGLVLVALVGTALIARRVSRPVGLLTDASRHLADGRFDVRVPARGRNELARLSASFNAMAEAVQRSEERQRRLIADVAHEMRTPLSNLRGYLEGLSDGVVEPSRELFASLHEETLLQGRILDDLQVLALAEAGELRYDTSPTDLSDLVAASVMAHQVAATEAGVTVHADASTPVWVQGDTDRLRQVIGNLLTNALRYTDRGGRVVVRARVEWGEAVFAVEDTGVGIAAGDLPHVFDRFWRADPARQRATGGTGLGLTIAHRIVSDHRGRIEVRSRHHFGTAFTVRLPSCDTPFGIDDACA